MAYEKQRFSPGQVLTADHMNHIEDGIGDLSEEIGNMGGACPYMIAQYPVYLTPFDKPGMGGFTYEVEILDALTWGLCVCYSTDNMYMLNLSTLEIRDMFALTNGTGKNLNASPYDATKTTGGVTFTLNDNGSIALSGTPTTTIYYFAGASASVDKRFLLPAGTYTLNSGYINEKVTATCFLFESNSATTIAESHFSRGYKTTFTTETDMYAVVSITIDPAAGNLDGKNLYIQLEAGDAQTFYAPPIAKSNAAWYCGKILPRYGVPDYLLMWDRNTKALHLVADDNSLHRSFPAQRLGWLRNTGIDYKPNEHGFADGTIIYAEYYLPDYGVETPVVRVMRSTDYGLTWTQVFSQNTRLNESPEVFHFHFVRHDPYNAGHWYIGSGDSPSESNIWRSVDDGLTWTKVNDPAFSGDLQSIHRTCDVHFTEDYLYWGTDDSVNAMGQGDGGKWVRTPRNLDTNQFEIEVLSDLGDWVRVMVDTPYGVLLATESRFSDYSYVWIVPHEDLTKPVLVARPHHTFANQVSRYSWGSRVFCADRIQAPDRPLFAPLMTGKLHTLEISTCAKP